MEKLVQNSPVYREIVTLYFKAMLNRFPLYMLGVLHVVLNPIEVTGYKISHVSQDLWYN